MAGRVGARHQHHRRVPALPRHLLQQRVRPELRHDQRHVDGVTARRRHRRPPAAGQARHHAGAGRGRAGGHRARFEFGAGYATDPTNATTPSSFDKGHGLVDTVAALHDVLSGTAVSSAGACTGVSGTDAAGEPQPYLVAAANGPYDPKVDLRSVALTGDPNAQKVTLRLGVGAISNIPPAGAAGTYAEATFIVGTATHTMDIEFDPTGVVGDVDGKPAADGAAVVDAATKTLTLTVKRDAFDPDLGGVFHVGGVNVQIGRFLGASGGGLILWSDSASAGCGDIDAGGTAPAAPPPPAAPTPAGSVSPGAPYTWKGAPATVVTDPVGAGVILAVEGGHQVSKPA